MDAGLSLVPRQARPYQGRRAGLVTRSVAGVVDAGVVGAALVASYAGLNVVRFMIDPREFQPTSAPLGTGLTIALATCVLYLAVAWTSSGRTYGDHLLGLRVVGRQGDRVGFLRALVRAIFCVGFPVGLVSAMSSTSRRSVQDLVLRTDVIYDWASTHGRTDNGSPVTSSGPEGSGP